MQVTFHELLPYTRFPWVSERVTWESDEHFAPSELVYEPWLSFGRADGAFAELGRERMS